MSDKVDDLILQMQHLGASARAAEQARAGQLSSEKLKTRAMKLAAAAQAELEAAEKKVADGQDQMLKARQPGVPPLEAGELFAEGRSLQEVGKPAAIKARARLNFALEAMDEAERRAWDALQADARAEAHAQLAEVATPVGASSLAPAPLTSSEPTAAPTLADSATTEISAASPTPNSTTSAPSAQAEPAAPAEGPTRKDP